VKEHLGADVENVINCRILIDKKAEKKSVQGIDSASRHGKK
jgi:hypothetical protein